MSDKKVESLSNNVKLYFLYLILKTGMDKCKYITIYLVN